ncbi:AAA family ATPase [Vibrio alginolyticus]|uniref:AAA family ATPase n=1 Tax=Vibrio TaxID=662 RepID=UPI00197DCD4F|nr:MULTISPECIES: AAA family ATPase [Vibrio]MDW1836231.1 AAA family ATPase [Vibrio sp. Vb0718]QSI81253.1 AAA family ATPase [Vibrio alginolyticus]URR27206.1 AAA family ATPase [Vibrio alginolyticus]
MTIPATHAEIEQIYLQSEQKGHKTICVVGCKSEDGVTSVASSLAERLVLAGHNTLYVDLNLFKPAYHTVHEFDDDEKVGHLITRENTHQTLVGLPAPSIASTQLAYRDPTTLKQNIAQWLTQYERVVIDTSPLLSVNRSNIAPQVIAGVCDATLLVAHYGSTTATQLEQAKKLLDASDANLIGSVLNMKHTPSLKDELIRQVSKLRFLPKKWKEKLSQQIKKSELFML